MKQKMLVLISILLLITLMPLTAQANPGVAVVTIKATDPYAAERGPTGAPDTGTFTVYRSNSTSTVALTVYYSLSGTATNSVDYQTLTGKVIIPAGAASANIVVTPILDSVLEGQETVIAKLIQPTCITMYPPPADCYQVGTPDSATVYIRD